MCEARGPEISMSNADANTDTKDKESVTTSTLDQDRGIRRRARITAINSVSCTGVKF